MRLGTQQNLMIIYDAFLSVFVFPSHSKPLSVRESLSAAAVTAAATERNAKLLEYL
jgi:hypothetical protein